MFRSEEIAHEENGSLTQIVEFPFHEVSKNLKEKPEIDEEFSPEEIEAACKVFTSLVSWIWQNGMKNPNGITIRAIIVCWLFVKELRPLSLTEIARGFGKKKQSLGRWVEDFKLKFPNVKSVHMK